MPALVLRLLLGCACLTLGCSLAGVARAQADLCDQAAARIAEETGIPLAVLRSLTRAETGRARGGRLEPWPWAVNQGGAGHWFASQQEAEAFVRDQLGQGFTNLDIGCFQLNHRWHAKGFASLSEMFEPGANARYAAAYLLDKYRETGDWVAAAGAYHSGTEGFARSYSARFQEIFDTLAPAEIQLAQVDDATPSRGNLYPLLRAGLGGSAGSLVPRTDGMGSLFARVP